MIKCKIQIIFLFFCISCTSYSPSNKKYIYSGEAITEIKPNGLLIGKIIVPYDSFPHNNRKTRIYFRNVKTKEVISFGDTKDLFYLQIPEGNYEVESIDDRGMCFENKFEIGHNLYIPNFLSPDTSSLQAKINLEPKSPYNFQIEPGTVTNLGDILSTCFEWNATKRMKETFANFIQDAKFTSFNLPTQKSNETCSCKLLVRENSELSQNIFNHFKH